MCTQDHRPVIRNGINEAYRVRKNFKVTIQKIWIMNMQHEQRQNKNNVCIRAQIKFRFQFSFEIRQRWWLGNSWLGDRLFQTRAAATGNARSPIVERFVLGKTSGVVDDRRCRPEKTSDARWSSDDRCDGVIMLTTEHLNGIRFSEIVQQRSDMIVLPDRENHSNGCFHDRLKSVDAADQQEL